MSAIRKSEFAKLCNVSAPGVSQWISGGKIDGKAIVGEGRGALIDVDLARAQLKERLSTNERCGLNGLNTKLDDVPARRSGPALPNVGGDVAESAPAARRQRVDSAPEDDEDPGSVDAQLKTEKLEQNKILTRKLRTEERARDGILHGHGIRPRHDEPNCIGDDEDLRGGLAGYGQRAGRQVSDFPARVAAPVEGGLPRDPRAARGGAC